MEKIHDLWFVSPDNTYHRLGEITEDKDFTLCGLDISVEEMDITFYQSTDNGTECVRCNEEFTKLQL